MDARNRQVMEQLGMTVEAVGESQDGVEAEATNRAVARQPVPSASCLAMATRVSSAERRPSSAVLVRSEKSEVQLNPKRS